MEPTNKKIKKTLNGNCWRKLFRYIRFYLAQTDDSNAEIVQIYRKSVLSKFLRCAVNIHLIFDREKFAFRTCWRDNWKTSLKFHGMPASFEKYSISLVLFGTIGWFKCWNTVQPKNNACVRTFFCVCKKKFCRHFIPCWWPRSWKYRNLLSFCDANGLQISWQWTLFELITAIFREEIRVSLREAYYFYVKREWQKFAYC